MMTNKKICAIMPYLTKGDSVMQNALQKLVDARVYKIIISNPNEKINSFRKIVIEKKKNGFFTARDYQRPFAVPHGTRSFFGSLCLRRPSRS
jgi:hypothetical protein